MSEALRLAGNCGEALVFDWNGIESIGVVVPVDDSSVQTGAAIAGFRFFLLLLFDRLLCFWWRYGRQRTVLLRRTRRAGNEFLELLLLLVHHGEFDDHQLTRQRHGAVAHGHDGIGHSLKFVGVSNVDAVLAAGVHVEQRTPVKR